MTLEVVSLALGAYQTNCYVVSTEGSTDAVVIDPGDSAETVLRVLAERGLALRGILVTHGHLDHIGAVRDLAEQTGVEVWMARDDADDLRTFGPAPYDPQHGVSGGDEVEVAGIRFRVLDVPGHTAGSVAFVTDGVAFVGDVLFAGSIGRTDLQGGDLDTLDEVAATLEGALEDFTAYRQADIRLHVGLAEVTRSATLVRAMTEVQGAMTDLISYIAHPPEVLASSNAQHRRLLAAVRERDEMRAALVMTEHLQGTEHVLAGLLPAG